MVYISCVVFDNLSIFHFIMIVVQSTEYYGVVLGMVVTWVN